MVLFHLILADNLAVFALFQTLDLVSRYEERGNMSDADHVLSREDWVFRWLIGLGRNGPRTGKRERHRTPVHSNYRTTLQADDRAQPPRDT